jgi:flagellar basal body-associated protein FliL
VKKSRRTKNAEKPLLREKLTTILVGALVLAMLATVVLLVWQKSTQRVMTGDYDGRIVDRWGAYSESEQGSRPRFRLLVESQDSKRFTVNVDASVYESARVGMRIKSRSGQVVLIDSEQRTTGNK